MMFGCFLEASKRHASLPLESGTNTRMRPMYPVGETGLAEAPEPECGPAVVPARMVTRGVLKKSIEENRQAPRFIPDDLLALALCVLVRDFPLRPASNPIGHLASVSQQWRAFFKSELFWITAIATPNLALYLLMSKREFAPELIRDLFMSAKGLLLEAEQLGAIMGVENPEIMIELGKLSYGRLEEQSALSMSQRLPLIMPDEYIPKYGWKKVDTFWRKLELLFGSLLLQPPEEYILMKMDPADLMRLFYLQDLQNHPGGKWLFTLFAQQVSYLYHMHPEVRLQLAARMQELSRVTLPRSHTSLVFECTGLVMFIAAFAKDFDFLRMLGLDYAALEGLYAGEEHLVKDIREFRDMAEGSQAKISLGMIGRHSNILDRMLGGGTCGFNVAAIKQTFREILGKINPRNPIFEKVHNYVSFD